MRYIGGESYRLNEKLRNSAPLSSDEIRWVEALDSVLTKLPRYHGTLRRSLTFYGHASVKAFLAEHQIGSVLSYPAYTSTTASEELYNPHGQVQMFVIQSRQGGDMRAFNDSEQEILYGRGARFEVINIKRIGKQYHIYLKEIPND